MNRSRPSRRAASRTPSRPIDAQLVRRCVLGAGALSVFPLATPLPSTASVELPLLFGGFSGNMGVSDFSSVSMAGLRLLAFPAPPAPRGTGTDETCAGNFPACAGSPTARDRRRTGDLRPATYCLPLRLTASASRISDFAAQYLACQFPLSTLQSHPRERHCMTRGRNDSPRLSRIELSSTISCQLLLAH